MAEMQPSDIGLATFADVGDVAALRTAAKTVVEAINEVYQTGGEGQQSFGTQWYVDGENNIIFGNNNVVYGSNNVIIGSDNILIGDNHTVFQNSRYVYNSSDISMEYFDAETKRLYYYVYSDEEIEIPFHVGDKVIVSAYMQWVDEGWNDWMSIESGKILTEITEVNTASQYITVNDLNISEQPPDEIHTMLDYCYISTFVLLSDAYKKNASLPSGVNMGSAASGSKSFSANNGSALGNYSFAGNASTSKGSNSTSFGGSTVVGNYGFAANQGKAYNENSAAFNYSYCYSPYSMTMGYGGRTYGRAIKCLSINTSNRSLTIASGEDLSGITEGTEIIVRCYNCINTIIFNSMKVQSVSGNTIYLDSNAYMGGSGSYAYSLFPDGYIFVNDNSTSKAQSSFAGGYGYSCAKYSFADGLYVGSLKDGAVTFGKYGFNTDEYSIALANGTSHKALGLAFKVLSDGSVHADGEYTSPCADYAEYFEWEDGNPNNEDRVGYFVKLQGDKIVKCDEFDTPLGVVSAMPAIIGDSGEMHWQGKFVTDDFGRIQYHDVVIPAELDADGKIIVEEHTETQPIINPNWDSSAEYIPRKNRSEWSTVGVLGKLIVFDDGALCVGDKCRCGNGGKAVKTIENGYHVLKRVSDDKVLIWVR